MERLASIIGTMFVSAAFGLVFLYTGELAPTTHRGFVMSSCSMLARIGERSNLGGGFVSLKKS